MAFQQTAQAFKYQEMKAVADELHKEYMKSSDPRTWEKFLNEEMNVSIYAMENEDYIWETS